MLDVDAARAPAFVLESVLEAGVGPAHVHRRHQLLFAASGHLRLKVPKSHETHTLPPYRAAWIPAGCEHSVEVRRRATLATAYFAPSARAPERVAVFPMPPVGRELLLHARRWDATHTPTPASRACLAGLEALAIEWTEAPGLALPEARTPELQRARMAIDAEPSRAWTLEELARVAGLSTRTLSRRMQDELGEGLRAHLTRLRVHVALERLAEPGASVSVVATDLGFASPSAFAQAFRRHVGETPSRYAARSRG